MRDTERGHNFDNNVPSLFDKARNEALGKSCLGISE